MNQVNSTGIKIPKSSWRLLPFLVLGVLVFAFNSSLELNYLVKGYITLLELQAGIVVLYFLLAKLGKFLYLLFFWTFIPGIIAFFEFIGLIIMSDQAFDAKYNPNYLANSTERRLPESGQQKTATLLQLKKLYDQGIITAEEYEEKRRKYLDSL